MGKKSFLKELKNECKQIVWPKKDEVIKKTSLVLLISFVLTLLIFALDSVYSIALNEFLESFM